MNKQELIEKIKKMDSYMFNFRPHINETQVLNYIRQLDEPQRVTVPQIVADYIEYTKATDWDLQEAMDDVAYEDNKDLRKWFNDNIETFARAWLDGYKVEKEKRYLVKMKNLRALFCYLAYIPDEGYWTLMASGGESIVIKHTRKQLEEAGFGWVFDCPGIEIEEVEDDSKV